MTFTTRKEAREAGWFSRRHRTSDAHFASVSAYESRRGRQARRRRADERNASRSH